MGHILVAIHYMYMCCFALFLYLTLLASFFLPSHLSIKHACITYSHVLRNCMIIVILTA